jgi:hypothetical protein
MRSKLAEALGMGAGMVAGSILYQILRSAPQEIDLARALFIGVFVGLIWLVIPLRLFNGRNFRNHDVAESKAKVSDR